MKIYCFLITVFFLAITNDHAFSLPIYGLFRLDSPDHQYSLKLVDTNTSDRWAYDLVISRNNTKLASYIFEGELASAYWSPTLKYVAINNNDAHAGIIVWIISLTDGAVITSHGAKKSSKYDRYLDYGYFPYLPEAGGRELRKVYPGAHNDQLRDGYTTVAYGWKSPDELLMFHELPFTHFVLKYNRILQAHSTFCVSDKCVRLKSVEFSKVRNQPDEPMPKEVENTLK